MILTDLLFQLYDAITPFQAALATSILMFFLIYLFIKDNDLPPGPIGLPLIGYWPFLKAETCHVQLREMVKTYGDVFSFRVAGRLFIHLGTIESIKDAHVTKSDCFAGRFADYSVLSFLFKDGVAIANGEPWKILRKFFLQKFKEYGMNAVKENATGPIDDALRETVQELREAKGQPIAISDIATAKCMLILRRILFNDQGITKEELQELGDNYTDVMTGMKSTTFLLVGKLAKYLIFPFMPSSWKMKRGSQRIDDILYEVVNRHKKDYDETQVADIIDCFFEERDDRRRRGDPTAAYFKDSVLVSSLSQFITDGTLTLGLLIGTFLLSLAEHPEEQDRIYEELMEVIGYERLPSLEDKNKLPYTNAFMYEVMRLTDLFSLFPSMECTKETTLQGHQIPKGSITLLNLHAAHRNPKVYDDPETFNPSRYLTSSDKKRPDLPIIFGVGKRACIGEAFSMIQAFLFVTTIVKNFCLRFPEDSQDASITFWSEKLKICAIPRSQKNKTV